MFVDKATFGKNPCDKLLALNILILEGSTQYLSPKNSSLFSGQMFPWFIYLVHQQTQPNNREQKLNRSQGWLGNQFRSTALVPGWLRWTRQAPSAPGASQRQLLRVQLWPNGQPGPRRAEGTGVIETGTGTKDTGTRAETGWGAMCFSRPPPEQDGVMTWTMGPAAAEVYAAAERVVLAGAGVEMSWGRPQCQR